jgi:hypothetical protein
MTYWSISIAMLPANWRELMPVLLRGKTNYKDTLYMPDYKQRIPRSAKRPKSHELRELKSEERSCMPGPA